MKTWRYVVVGGAALAWAAGCADLPSFPENFGVTGGAGMSGGGTPMGGDTMGGMAGMMNNPQAEIDDAVKNLKGWRYENSCGYVDGHPLNDGTCNSGEICWKDSNKARFKESKVIQIGGMAGHQYDVTLRIRGAIEPRDYPQNCMRLANS